MAKSEGRKRRVRRSRASRTDRQDCRLLPPIVIHRYRCGDETRIVLTRDVLKVLQGSLSPFLPPVPTHVPPNTVADGRGQAPASLGASLAWSPRAVTISIQPGANGSTDIVYWEDTVVQENTQVSVSLANAPFTLTVYASFLVSTGSGPSVSVSAMYKNTGITAGAYGTTTAINLSKQ